MKGMSIFKKHSARRFSIILSIIFMFALLCVSKTAKAEGSESGIENVKKSIVRVVCPLNDGSGKSRVGTGFAIGTSNPSKYIVTNNHVVDGMSTIKILLTRDQYVNAKVIISLEKTDIAVLELDKAINRDPVTFTSSEGAKVGQKVFVLGFPVGADINDPTANIDDITVTDGIISKIGEIYELTGVKCYQTSAAVNPGNSGGPFINEAGQVMGIAAWRSATAENVGLIIQSEELMTALDNVKIQYNKAKASSGSIPSSTTPSTNPPDNNPQPKPEQGKTTTPNTTNPSDTNTTGNQGKAEKTDSSSKSLTTIIIVASAIGVLGIAAIVIVIIVTRKPKNKKNNEPSYTRAVNITPTARKTGGKLVGISGYYAGKVIELGNDKVTFGRDHRVCQIVFPDSEDDIGRCHCSVRFDALGNAFILEDCASTNGTYLNSGRKLTPNTPERLVSGDKFYLSNPRNTFEVRSE